MTSQPRTFLDDPGGSSAPEYALVLAGMAAGVVIGLMVFGSAIGNALLASSHYVDQLALNFGPSAQTASAGGAAATPAAADETAGATAPAVSPGKSAAARGHGGSSPGKSGSAPGQNK